MNSPFSRAHAADCALLVLDLQEKLMPAIHEGERVLDRAGKFIQAMHVLQVPILVTEQYPKGIGPTCAPIKRVLGEVGVIEKLSFSGCGADPFWARWASFKRHTALVCGVESHVCVQQSVLDLLERGQRVYVLADAIGSRRVSDCEIALHRMRQAGAIITTTESVMFELLERAGTPQFKEILKLVK